MRDIAVTLITVDRSPTPNYLAETLENLGRAGLFNSERVQRFEVVDSGGPSCPGWVRGALRTVNGWPRERAAENNPGISHLWPPESERVTANKNVSTALRSAADPEYGARWCLFLEDDIDVCADFFDSVGAWLDDHAREDRRVYPLGANYTHVEQVARRGETAWEYPIDLFYGTQAVALRSDDAVSFARYLEANRGMRVWQTLPDGRRHLAVGDTGYDLIMKAWHRKRYPEIEHFLTPAPSFVQHIGMESVILPRDGVHTFPSWPGREWSYMERRAA